MAIAANTVYVASYYAPDGDYAADGGYFTSSGVTSGPLTALSNTAAGGNGVFAAGDVFPTSSFNASNYWVDVDFNPGSVNTPPPTVTAQTPAPGTTGVSTISSVSATFSEPVQPGTISFTLTDASGNAVSGVGELQRVDRHGHVHPHRRPGHVDPVHGDHQRGDATSTTIPWPRR